MDDDDDDATAAAVDDGGGGGGGGGDDNDDDDDDDDVVKVRCVPVKQQLPSAYPGNSNKNAKTPSNQSRQHTPDTTRCFSN